MGSSKTKTTKHQEVKNELPAYMREGSERAIQMATDRTNKQYEAYGGQRIADLSQNEQMGISMARDSIGQGDADFQSARDSLDRASGSFTDEGVAERYMNPYMEQVLAPTRRRQNEAFEAERARRRSDAGMTGAFGGRQQMWDNKFEQDFQQSQDELTGSAYGAAYESAANLYGQEQDRNLQQASAYSDLATSQASQRRTKIFDLMNSGLVERTRDQADLDFKYIEHLEGRDWDVSNLNTLVQALGGVPHETSQTSDSTETVEKKSDPMKMIAGVAMIAAGVMTGGAALAPMVAAGGDTMSGA